MTAAVLLLLGSVSAPAQAPAGAGREAGPTPLRFVFAGAFSSPRLEQGLRQVASALAAEVGMVAVVDVQPASRALFSFRQGQQDVDLGRVPAFDALVPGAHRLEPHVMLQRYHVVSADPDLQVSDWGQLAGMSVAHMRGIVAIIERLPKSAQAQPVASREACLAMAAARRVQACVLHSVQPQPQLQASAPQAAALHSRVIDAVPLYLWVTPSRPDLAQRLQGGLKALADRGELAASMGPLR